jgi:PAS domain S-box-containing protein
MTGRCSVLKFCAHKKVSSIRSDSWKGFAEWLQQRLVKFGQVSRTEIVTNVGAIEKSCCGVVIPIGVNSERGLIAAACDRADFPDQIDQQLLSVAANNAATAFQNALLINELRIAQIALRDQEQELRKARDELEIKVADRTSELRRSERELRDAIDTIPAIVWSTLPDGSNAYINKRFVEYSGSSAEQMAGSGWQALIHPDDLERHAAKWMEAVATGKPHENEVRSRRADGQYRWQLDRGAPLRDEDGSIVKWYGVTTDIEDRKRAEEALGFLSRDLQESKAKLEEAQRITHVGYWEWDILTDRVYWSDETYRIYGLRPQERPIDLATVREKIHPDDWGVVFRALEEALSGGARYNAECRVFRPTGEVRIIHSQGDLKRDTSGRPTLMFGTVQDITDRKRAEHERERLRQLEADLAHVNRVSTLGEMAASLAHEIKQPIAAAITSANSCIEWLAHEPPNLDRARVAAARIDKYGNRATEIIERIRSLYKKSPPQRELVDMNGIIKEMLTLLKGEAHRYPIAMRAELTTELPKIMVDRVQLQQVFMNLMLNAIEAMRDSGGELMVKSELQDGQLQFSVSDTGVGLPKEKMEEIFSAFFTTKPQGSGMGLAISRSIVESHGGRLWATANDGRGATFHFTLPAHMTETSSQVNL